MKHFLNPALHFKSVPRAMGCLVFAALAASDVHASPITVYPALTEGFSQSLNGGWSFKYLQFSLSAKGKPRPTLQARITP